jgi:2-aminoadipate transaminase
VGRGSFVNREQAVQVPVDASASDSGLISFASSRPSEEHFPLRDFQATCEEVIHGPHALQILQLGSPNGYGPLRHYLLEEARKSGEADAEDDVLVTNGCQQSLDLLQRSLVTGGETVVVEDPVYHGLRNVFMRGGARLIGVPMNHDGIDVAQLSRVLLQERPKILVVTSSFQNPTGASLPLAARAAIAKLARETGTLLVENAIYGDLQYEGEPQPTIKKLDPRSGILLRSFSKIAFPGLRVGWVIAPKPILAKLAEAKQWSDLHTDQLSQAIVHRFAESGRLAAHAERVRAMGRQRLHAVLEACERHLPEGTTFTRPQGGMSLWVRLPEPLDASDLLPRAQREGVSYLPGKVFAVSRNDAGTLRISFGGLTPEQIETGIARLGRIFRDELARMQAAVGMEAAPAIV